MESALAKRSGRKAKFKQSYLKLQRKDDDPSGSPERPHLPRLMEINPRFIIPWMSPFNSTDRAALLYKARQRYNNRSPKRPLLSVHASWPDLLSRRLVIRPAVPTPQELCVHGMSSLTERKAFKPVDRDYSNTPRVYEDKKPPVTERRGSGVFKYFNSDIIPEAHRMKPSAADIDAYLSYMDAKHFK